MKLEDLRNVYAFTPSMHNSILEVLDSLDDQSPYSYKKKRRIIKVIFICAIIIILSATTVVASATEMFGLFREPVGEYGINISVYEKETFELKENVTSGFVFYTDN